MNNSQKGAANPFLIIIIILLAAAVAYFVFIKKPQTVFEQIPVPTTSTDQSSTAGTSPKTQPSPTVNGYSIKSSDAVSVNENGVVIINGNLPVSGADPKTFKLLGDSYAKDSTHIWYYYSQGVTNEIQLAQSVDIPSFVILNNWYAKDKNNVYQPNINASGYAGQLEVMKGIDASTAVGLDSGNIKDAYHAYDFKGDVFSKIADVKTLVSFGDITSGTQWFKDSAHVYVGDGEIMDNADPATFKDLGIGYGKDKSRVFYSGDVPTFVITDSTPYKGSMISGADPASFAVVGEYYAKDNSHVFAGGQVLQYADPATFAQIGTSFFFKDKSHIWMTDDHSEQHLDLIPEADAATFTLVSNGSISAQDAHNTYAIGAKGGLIVTPKK